MSIEREVCVKVHQTPNDPIPMHYPALKLPRESELHRKELSAKVVVGRSARI